MSTTTVAGAASTTPTVSTPTPVSTAKTKAIKNPVVTGIVASLDQIERAALTWVKKNYKVPAEHAENTYEYFRQEWQKVPTMLKHVQQEIEADLNAAKAAIKKKI